MNNYLVHTPCGSVQGCQGKEAGVAVFKGVRYATADRWTYPKQVTAWSGIYNATQFGACSYQPRAFYNEDEVPEKAFYYNEFRRGEHYNYSEDCLFLNIWAPENAKHAPVLFYIHGGGFKGGCGHEKHFSGESYCRRGVIVVTCNYRLGPLGFCCLPQLKEEAGHTGNYGLFDQLCALEWVRDNIAAFGGDVNRITIAGQSAGAMSVQQLCVSPLTKDKFAGAMMLSGGGVSSMMGAKPAAGAYPFWQSLTQRLGKESLAELRAVAPARLFEAYNALCQESKHAMAATGPVLDGVLLTQTADKTAKAGEQRAVPYLMGSTSEDIVPPVVFKMAKGWARLQSEQNKPKSYTYFFCRQLPGDENGAWHSSDLWYMFGTLSNSWRPFTDWDKKLSDTMVDYFSNFVTTGNPNSAGLPDWLPMEKGQRKVMRFGDREIHMGGVSMGKLTHTMLTKPAVGE